MAAITAKYWMTLLVLTVFPAPDSPLLVQVRRYCLSYLRVGALSRKLPDNMHPRHTAVFEHT
jgi:hypothetical protein